MLKSIHDEWHGFAKMVFQGCTPSETQIREMRKAFYAGAWAVVTACEEIGEPHVDETTGIRWFESVRKECEAFKSELIKKYLETN